MYVSRPPSPEAQPLLCSAISDTVLNLMVTTWLLLLDTESAFQAGKKGLSG